MAVPIQYSLKELRARKNKTQREVASDMGISPTTYHYWERDISNVAISKVQAIANYYGVPLSQISLCPMHENNSCIIKEGMNDQSMSTDTLFETRKVE